MSLPVSGRPGGDALFFVKPSPRLHSIVGLYKRGPIRVL